MCLNQGRPASPSPWVSARSCRMNELIDRLVSCRLPRHVESASSETEQPGRPLLRVRPRRAFQALRLGHKRLEVDDARAVLALQLADVALDRRARTPSSGMAARRLRRAAWQSSRSCARPPGGPGSRGPGSAPSSGCRRRRCGTRRRASRSPPRARARPRGPRRPCNRTRCRGDRPSAPPLRRPRVVDRAVRSRGRDRLGHVLDQLVERRHRAGAELAAPDAVHVDVGDRVAAQVGPQILDPLGRAEQAVLLAVPADQHDRAVGAPAALEQPAKSCGRPERWTTRHSCCRRCRRSSRRSGRQEPPFAPDAWCPGSWPRRCSPAPARRRCPG